jgi:hypothetical protein
LEVEVDLVAKYMGDGVLGYFGYPQAHEDDAERAVRAGLAIVEAAPTLQTAAGVPLHVRVGIATGIVPPAGALRPTRPFSANPICGPTCGLMRVLLSN